MATELTTSSATQTVARERDVEFRPIDWWADLDDGAAHSTASRHKPPIPAFVRLSRLVDPEQIAVARGIEPTATLDASDAPTADTGEGDAQGIDPGDPKLLEYGPEAVPRRRWVDSAGRPLFRIGLAAIVAALVVGVTTFGPGGDDLTRVEAPDDGVGTPGFDGNADRAADNDEQTRQVLEALVRQNPGGGEADLSIVATASGDSTEIRWTATIRNAGPETVNGPITVVHTIGSDFELVSVAGSGWDCQQLRAAGTITCELDEELGTGQRRRLGLVTSVAGIEAGTSIASTMSVVAGTTDPNLDDNTINIMAETAPAEDDADDNRSRSTGAAGQAGSETDPDTTGGAAVSSNADQAGSRGMEELPRTGSGLAAVLGVAGVGLCLAGRRLTTWSARAQTRTMLVAANIS